MKLYSGNETQQYDSQLKGLLIKTLTMLLFNEYWYQIAHAQGSFSANDRDIFELTSDGTLRKPCFRESEPSHLRESLLFDTRL